MHFFYLFRFDRPIDAISNRNSLNKMINCTSKSDYTSYRLEYVQIVRWIVCAIGAVPLVV